MTKRKKVVTIFVYHMKEYYLSFMTGRMVGGATPSP